MNNEEDFLPTKGDVNSLIQHKKRLVRQIEELTKENEALKVAGEWRPVSNPPENGTDVFAKLKTEIDMNKTEDNYTVAHFYKGKYHPANISVDYGANTYLHGEVTHWKPLEGLIK